MTLTLEEFLLRFLQYGLPKGLPRIRYFRWLANRRTPQCILVGRFPIGTSFILLKPALLPSLRRFQEHSKPIA